MKLLQILELLTLIAEKIAFWKQAEKKADGIEQKQAAATDATTATKNDANFLAQQNAENSANSAKKANLGTAKEENTDGK